MDETQHPGSMVRLMAWIKQPFNSDMTAIDWLLFLGLILVGVFLWTRILHTIVEEI